MRLPPSDVRATGSSSYPEVDYGPPIPQPQYQYLEYPEKTYAPAPNQGQRAMPRSPPELRVPLHIGLCQSCSRLYKGAEVSEDQRIQCLSVCLFSLVPSLLNVLIFVLIRATRVLIMMICSTRREEMSINTGTQCCYHPLSHSLPSSGLVLIPMDHLRRAPAMVS